MDPVRSDSSERATVIAAFDVDKTLTTRDCVVPFLRLVGGRRLVGRLVIAMPSLALALVSRDRDRVKAIAARAAVRGRSEAAVDDVARRFADRVWRDRMRPDTVGRLRWHVERGHQVVLVSASFRNYLEPLAEQLGVQAVLATELEVVDGVCTGRLRGPNCRASVKAERLRAWIDERGWGAVEIHAYGDSDGDRQMLAMADRATLVGSSSIDIVPSDANSRAAT